MGDRLVRMYRTAEDFHRDAWAHEDRRKAMDGFYHAYRPYFRHRVLDIGAAAAPSAGSWSPRAARTWELT